MQQKKAVDHRPQPSSLITECIASALHYTN
jgi:hypothetical protein